MAQACGEWKGQGKVRTRQKFADTNATSNWRICSAGEEKPQPINHVPRRLRDKSVETVKEGCRGQRKQPIGTSGSRTWGTQSKCEIGATRIRRCGEGERKTHQAPGRHDWHARSGLQVSARGLPGL